MLRLMKLYAISHGLRIPDALIAATAMEENLTLVTANIKHFSFIKDLSLLDWKKERIEYSSRN
jgi:predicted nucleic acid-binding protein